MSKESEEKVDHLVWINYTDKIISFKETEGFELIRFNSREEKMTFSLGKCYSGFRIQ